MRQIVVHIVGRSDSGKTGLLEALVPELQSRGHRVAVAKHCPTVRLGLDEPGKDTARLRATGAERVLMLAADAVALGVREGWAADYALPEPCWFGDCDIILVEGLHGAAAPKVEVLGREPAQPPLYREIPGVLAVVAADDGRVPPDAPRAFRAADLAALCDRLTALPGIAQQRYTLAVTKDGAAPVPLNPFVEGWLISAIRGLLEPLSGCAAWQTLTMRLWPAEKRVEIADGERPIPLKPYVACSVAGSLAGLLLALRGTAGARLLTLILRRQSDDPRPGRPAGR